MVAVLDSPGLVGVLSGSGHEDINFTSWHKLLLRDGKVLVHHPFVSLWSVGSDSLTDSSGKLVEPPLSTLGTELGITVIVNEFLLGSEVLESSLISPDPLLGKVSSLLVVDDGITFLLSENHFVHS